jgi:hypothetical protein
MPPRNNAAKKRTRTIKGGDKGEEDVQMTQGTQGTQEGMEGTQEGMEGTQEEMEGTQEGMKGTEGTQQGTQGTQQGTEATEATQQGTEATQERMEGSGDVVEKGMIGKKRAKRAKVVVDLDDESVTKKAKGKKRAKDGEDVLMGEGEGGEGAGTGGDESMGEDEEVEEVERRFGGGVSTEDEDAQRAVFSLNKIDFRTPPAKLIFGKWNNRPVTEKHVKQLLGSMKKQGVRAFNPANRIPLIVEKGDLASNCVTRDTTLGSEVPMLELSEAGKGKGGISAAGGQHRWYAWKMAFDQGRSNIQKIEGQLSGLRNKALKGDKSKANRTLQIEKLEGDIASEKAFMDAISVWGTVAYDACKWCIEYFILILI